MKKIFIFTFILTLIFSLEFSSPVSALDPKYDTVKVGIYYSSTAKDRISISSDNGFYVGYMNGPDFVSLYALSEASLNVSYFSATGLVINGTVYNISNGNFALNPVNGVVKIGDRLYRGGVEFIPNSSSKLTVINFVGINDYIAAVVGKEMSPSWPIEALKAQAVCARSYFISVWNKHSSLGFNVCNLQDCQTYLGISGEDEITVRAAMETKDQVLTYNGKVASTLYSSSNGGSSAYSKYVWGNDIPYLQAVLDIYENPMETSYSPWTVTLTNSQIQDKLAAAGKNIGNVYDMKVTGADEYGRTYKVTIYGTNGTYDLVNDRTRSFFGLRSQKYTITSSNTPVSAVYASGNSGSKQLSSFSTIGSGGISSSGANIYVTGSSGTKTYTASANQSVAPGTYILNGAGWGHGIGMSQWGAKAMADKGFNYKEILSFYYNGTTLE